MKRFKTILLTSIYILLLSAVSVSAQNIQAGYGWSILNDETAAAGQAAAMLEKRVSSPEFVVLYTTVGYDVKKLIGQLRMSFGAHTKIFGLTSCNGVITRDGVHVGERGALALLGMSSLSTAWGVSGSAVIDAQTTRAAAAAGARRAVADAGKPPLSRPDLVLMAASPGLEEQVLGGIADTFGADVPVYGGSAADNSISGNWKVFNNDDIYTSGFSLAVVFTPLGIGHAFHSGYLVSHKTGIATKVKDGESRILLEIDGRPAATVYNEWAYNKFSNQVAKGGSILGPASFFPLATQVTSENGNQFISIHPSAIDSQNGAIHLFANIKEGRRLYFTEGTPDALIHRPKTIIRRALTSSRIKRQDAALGLLIYCGGTMLAVKDRIDEIVPIINRSIGSAPYIGAFTFGEQGNIPGYGNFQGNLMSSMVVISRTSH